MNQDSIFREMSCKKFVEYIRSKTVFTKVSGSIAISESGPD